MGWWLGVRVVRFICWLRVRAGVGSAIPEPAKRSVNKSGWVVVWCGVDGRHVGDACWRPIGARGGGRSGAGPDPQASTERGACLDADGTTGAGTVACVPG